jgi:hypothetical protein
LLLVLALKAKEGHSNLSPKTGCPKISRINIFPHKLVDYVQKTKKTSMNE